MTIEPRTCGSVDITKEQLLKAYQDFEDNAFHSSSHPQISEESKAIAMRVIAEQIENSTNQILSGKKV